MWGVLSHPRPMGCVAVLAILFIIICCLLVVVLVACGYKIFASGIGRSGSQARVSG